MRILILYGTSEGQTRKVADFLAHRLVERSFEVAVANVDEHGRDFDPKDFDAAILAGRVHAGRYPRALVRFAKRHAPELARMPSAFISVGLVMVGERPGYQKLLAGYIAKLIAKAGWRPGTVCHVAGARYYTRHNAFARWLLGRIDGAWLGERVDTTRDHEFTDWHALGEFADRFAGGLRPSPQAKAA